MPGCIPAMLCFVDVFLCNALVFVPRKGVFRCFTQSQAAFQVMLPVSFLIFLAVWLVLLPAAYHTTGTDMGLLSPAALASHNLNLDCGLSWSNVCWLHGWGMVAVGKPWCSTISERSPVFAATIAARLALLLMHEPLPAGLFFSCRNFLFMFVEALVNRLCITTFHLTFIFYYGALYVIFSWIFFSFYHFFFYFFIDWRYSLVLMGSLAALATKDFFSTKSHTLGIGLKRRLCGGRIHGLLKLVAIKRYSVELTLLWRDVQNMKLIRGRRCRNFHLVPILSIEWQTWLTIIYI